MQASSRMDAAIRNAFGGKSLGQVCPGLDVPGVTWFDQSLSTTLALPACSVVFAPRECTRAQLRFGRCAFGHCGGRRITATGAREEYEKALPTLAVAQTRKEMHPLTAHLSPMANSGPDAGGTDPTEEWF